MRAPMFRGLVMIRALAVATVLLSNAGTAQAQEVVGDWQGTLKIGASTLHWVFHLRQDKAGLVASLDSPDQGVLDVPVATVTFIDRRLTLVLDVVAGSYEGLVSADGATIDGKWIQDGQSTPLTLTRVPPGAQ